MKLWEIKAQALKIMFTDSDIEYAEIEFEEGSIYDNSNTREKLIRMEDSIRRAIDLYYVYVGVPTLITELKLSVETTDDIIRYTNDIDLSSKSDFGEPLRVDALLYFKSGETLTLRKTLESIGFVYNPMEKKIWFYEQDFSVFEDNVVFRIWYRMKKNNIPYDASEMEFDLNTIYIPEDVQRYLPYFIKAELYEEDEPDIALNFKSEYINFLRTIPKPFNKVQTKVKRSKIFR